MISVNQTINENIWTIYNCFGHSWRSNNKVSLSGLVENWFSLDMFYHSPGYYLQPSHQSVAFPHSLLSGVLFVLIWITKVAFHSLEFRDWLRTSLCLSAAAEKHFSDFLRSSFTSHHSLLFFLHYTQILWRQSSVNI